MLIKCPGVLYLYMKTIERCHTPKDMWERVKLSANSIEALKQIDMCLAFWPKHIKNKAKQRLIRLRQVQVRSRKILKAER